MRRPTALLAMLALSLLLASCGESADEPITSESASTEENMGEQPRGDDDAGRTATDPTAESSQPPGTTTPEQSPAETPSPGRIEVPSALGSYVALAQANLAGLLNVDEAAITVAVAEFIEWPNASLGCPERDIDYRNVRVDGWRTVLVHEGVEYRYHGGGDHMDPFLCLTPDFPPN